MRAECIYVPLCVPGEGYAVAPLLFSAQGLGPDILLCAVYLPVGGLFTVLFTVSAQQLFPEAKAASHSSYKASHFRSPRAKGADFIAETHTMCTSDETENKTWA